MRRYPIHSRRVPSTHLRGQGWWFAAGLLSILILICAGPGMAYQSATSRSAVYAAPAATGTADVVTSPVAPTPSPTATPVVTTLATTTDASTQTVTTSVVATTTVVSPTPTLSVTTITEPTGTITPTPSITATTEPVTPTVTTTPAVLTLSRAVLTKTLAADASGTSATSFDTTDNIYLLVEVLNAKPGDKLDLNIRSKSTLQPVITARSPIGPDGFISFAVGSGQVVPGDYEALVKYGEVVLVGPLSFQVIQPTATPVTTTVTTAAGTPAISPTVTPQPSQTATVLPTLTPTPSVGSDISSTPTVIVTTTATPAVTGTPVVSPVITLTPTATPVVTATPTGTPTITGTPTVSPIVTTTPTVTPVITGTPTVTVSPTPTVTVVVSGTPTLLQGPSNFNYTGQLTGKNITLDATISMTVAGGANGWHIVFSSDPFKAGTRTIPGKHHTIQGVTISDATGIPPVNSAVYPMIFPTKSETVFSAAPGTGTGQVTLTFKTRLVVPQNTLAGKFNMTLNVSIVEGPL